ncbi:hypothetical protein BDW42DRAFT_143247 [Aspergillus taichungensis]|uniref:Transcription factor domain-containing protein n=1 Tax=Aspergillus taichungensis TaxID=482145 RepID=A0A2J5HMT4_9EURO|nr:hypothetical protein BDW42DRAFT_143247 [Aspergillus taichungensis]
MMVGEVVADDSPKHTSSYPPPTPAPDPPAIETTTRPTWPDSSPVAPATQAPPPTYPVKAPPAPSTRSFSESRGSRLMYPGSIPGAGAGSGPGSVPGAASGYGLEGGQPMMNRTAVELLSPAISNSHDALHLLSEAAGRTEDLNRQSRENRYAARQSVSSFNSPMSPMTQAGTPHSAGGSFSRPPRSGAIQVGQYYQANGSESMAAPGAADDRAPPSTASGPPRDPGFQDAVRAWSRLRFVRAGWLSVEECMAYVAHYYEHLAPLSPIVIADFAPPSTHRALLTDEPVLAVTILTTASRHMKPKGDGAYTRAFYIHDRLWSYLRGMIERLFWGQEKFGGGGGGVSTSKPRSFDLAAPATRGPAKGNLRSLGTIEALLILTDWHPRNLHFPPGDDENALLDLDAHAQLGRADRDHHHHHPHHNHPEVDLDHNAPHRAPTTAAEGRLAFQKWLEPAWRSDRMSWMLLSTAQALAFELGVFDQRSEARVATEPPAEQTRKRRLRRLILVYITQSSGRLGIPSMLPLPQWTNDIQPTVEPGADGDQAVVDRMHDCWIGISKIMYQSNQLLFASNEQTSELIRSGRYRDQIDRFQPFLREWRRDLDSIHLAPAMRSILLIEYEYTRLYVNSLALQAVVDRWTTMSNEAAQAKPASSGSGGFHVLMELYRVNEPYIQEVVDASRRILTTVLEVLVPEDHLKHAPVRTCFRILSGMIFILKTFTLGAKEDDVRVSLDLQDRVIEALRTHVVDDVHLSHAISRLLELLTTSIRTRFLRFAPLDRGGDGEAPDRNSAPVSRPHSPRPRDGPANRRDGASMTPWTPAPSSQNLSYSDGTAPPPPPQPAHQQQQQQQPQQQQQQQQQQQPPQAPSQTGSTPMSAHDPLAGIPAQPINSSNINVSFMPPPPSVYYNYYDPHATPPAGSDLDGLPPSQSLNDHAAVLPDWFALPLDQFFNSSTAVVDQGLGGTGPMVGELDMLEVLLNEQYDGSNNPGGEGGESGMSPFVP